MDENFLFKNPGSTQFWGYIGGLLFCFFVSMSNRPPGLTRASQKSVYTAKFRKNFKGMSWKYILESVFLIFNIGGASFQYISNISPLILM